MKIVIGGIERFSVTVKTGKPHLLMALEWRIEGRPA
jgi:hypothetical protein